jgi:transcriptional regulator with XRE-family HTH domain
MMKPIADDFFPWLDQRLRDLNWTDYRLAKKAGISHSVLSKARSGQGIGWDAAVAIARALGIHPSAVLIQLGLLSPTDSEHTAPKVEMMSVFSTLDKEDQEELIQIARLRSERKKRRPLAKNANS